MSEQNTESGADSAAEGDVGPDQTKPDRGPYLLIVILVLVAFGAGYYWTHSVYRPEVERLEARLAMLEASDSGLESRLGASEKLLATASAGAGKSMQRLNALDAAQATLEQSLSGLYAKESQTTLDWVLAEVEYLVFAAAQRLALERDVTTARAALKVADLRLAAAQHPDLIGLRATLAADMAALDAVAVPDTEGLAVYLAETVTSVERLPTKPIADLDMSFSRMNNEVAASQDWRGMARALWADVRSLVEIKDGELEDGVLFDPELRYFLQQNLRLELASARLAVLQRDNANFRAAADLVVDLLKTYYDTDAAAVSAVITRLGKARSINLEPTIPGVSASLDAVRAKRAAVSELAALGPRP